jgi:hypothetical protein
VADLLWTLCEVLIARSLSRLTISTRTLTFERWSVSLFDHVGICENDATGPAWSSGTTYGKRWEMSFLGSPEAEILA